MSTDTAALIHRALISVSDKTGLETFVAQLQKKKIEILSTGGTREFLSSEKIETLSVSDYTDYPEIMGGRVKTLHPGVHGGILGRRGIDDDVMVEQGIVGIDLVVVNLYPFAQTVSDPECSLMLAIENIDIGGPAMIRAAAKNYRHVTVIVDPADYSQVITEVEETGGVCESTRFMLAAKAFAHTAAYDTLIAEYLQKQRHGRGDEKSGQSSGASLDTAFTDRLELTFQRRNELRYGENPHQRAAFYVEDNPPQATLATARQWQGKSLSYNNIADTDAALSCVKGFAGAACVIVKHANPCGVALGSTPLEAYERAFAADSVSAFGGVIAFNQPLDATVARTVISRQFAEVIIAPEISSEALSIFSEKVNLRVLSCGVMPVTMEAEMQYKRISGGLLVQTADQHVLEADKLNVVSQRQPGAAELSDLYFAWQVVKHVKSNAIVYARAGQSIGIGAGQMSRVYSVRIAAMKAEEEGVTVEGAVMASDAFFPFRDGIDAAADTGIKAVIQPGGSIRDQDIIDAADEHGMVMIFTGVRHFFH